MGLLKGLIGGLVGGVIGAAIWAAIAYFAHLQIGIIASVVGALVGAGVSAGVGNGASSISGIMACAIALASVAGGKYWAIHAYVGKASKQVMKQIVITDEWATRYMAKSLIPEYESQGKALQWPAGKDKDTATEVADFPKPLWDDASKRWQAMSPNDQEAYRGQVEQFVRGSVEQKVSELEQDEFIDHINLFDILWAGLALTAAFKLGSGGSGGTSSD